MNRSIASILCLAMLLQPLGGLCAGAEPVTTESAASQDSEERAYIEETLDLANDPEQEWSYDRDSDSWTLSIVSAVCYPVIESEQGVSVNVPGAYVTGIDVDRDGIADVTAAEYTETTAGSLVIDYAATVTSTNGQTYTAATAPVILNTGAAGYGSATNTLASSSYASEGYINVACGNRGKQSTATDENGDTYYTGDAPDCLVDQKNAARFVKYNILLGNLPGNVDLFVSTGGSGGGAHAAMFAATGNHPDFYDYEIECGAVGVYRNEDGSYSTSIEIDGVTYELSDGAWGCIAYSAITSLAEADMAMAFEYYMDPSYRFNTAFQAQVAEYLANEYMEYINAQGLSVEEAAVGFDLNADGDTDDTCELYIEYDPERYPDTNGYGGTYTDLYLAEFVSNLQHYLDELAYAEGWTWFDGAGNALSDEAAASLTQEELAIAFIEGRYARSSSGSRGPMGGMPVIGGMPDGMPDGAPQGLPDGGPDMAADNAAAGRGFENADVAANSAGDSMDVGTPDAGTTQSAGSTRNASSYSSFEELLAAYEEDIAEIEAGDEYGNDIVALYDPLNYIGAEATDSATWVRIVCGASEGDISMFDSLNLQLAWLDAGVDAVIEWQWDGGHVPSEILGDSFCLYVDEMYGKYVSGVETVKPEAAARTGNGSATEATGTDISGWVDYSDISNVSFSLADAVAYRTRGASKAIPGFDVMDYGQEDYEFGSSDRDARHWDRYLLKVFEEHADTLAPLFLE